MLKIFILLCWALPVRGSDFTIGTYNLELYLNATNGSMKPKPAAARAKVRETLKAMNVDVLAVQEMGSPEAFAEFREALKADGLDYPHVEYVRGPDHTLHVAALSRFPIVARRSHTNDSFLLNGRRMHVLRGFSEIDIQVGANYKFTLMTAHLKSKRQAGLSDEEDVREQEAIILREKIDRFLNAYPDANLVVLGDLNDFRNTRSTRAVIGRGKNSLIDTRPAERNGDLHTAISQPGGGRQIVWTHYYAAEESYARLDYILLSRGMAHEWKTDGTYIFTTPNWGAGSDHRPLVATFSTDDR